VAFNWPLPGVQSPYARALRESKIARFRHYDCRHTWATRAVQAGIDLVTLAAMLGHSKINMVLRYAHPTQEHQTKAMDKMEQYVSEQKIAHAERSVPNFICGSVGVEQGRECRKARATRYNFRYSSLCRFPCLYPKLLIFWSTEWDLNP
jgi:hypothetical protein